MSTGMFTKDMKVSHALVLHPRTRAVFSEFNLNGCSGCVIAEYETLEQICDGYGIPIDEFMKKLNSLD